VDEAEGQRKIDAVILVALTPHRPFQRSNKLIQTETKCLTESTEFDHVNAPPAALTLAYEGLRLSDPLCTLRLR